MKKTSSLLQSSTAVTSRLNSISQHAQSPVRWLQFKMGISSKLKTGRLVVNATSKILEVDGKHFIDYNELSPEHWGEVYEKYVGQIFEDEGFDVDYRGLNLGYTDGGIDLVASNQSDVFFIQCKYVQKVLSKSHIEWILYKASPSLLRLSSDSKKKVHFVLAIQSIDLNFKKLRQSVDKSRFKSSIKAAYPLLDYFLSHNMTQSLVKLSVREISMQK